ncbi:MAG: glycosyltransferase [Thermodesulfobacteriota bacterium]
MDKEILRYLQARGIKGPWKICGTDRADFTGAIVIPALAEADYLWNTLKSLAQNPAEILDKFLTLIVVNHRQDAPPEIKKNNLDTLRMLATRKDSLQNLPRAWVDAASPGLELPSNGGVGFARKIGFDLALEKLNYQNNSPLLISLDADTLVRPDYLPALMHHFQNFSVGAAIIPFCHQQGSTIAEDQAIKRYELFLRAYVFGLKLAGSPYAFHTIGSTMACTAAAYVRAGGMNTRSAAEDFYFLQQLAKTSGLKQVKGTIVYPAARASWRVPFGTGKSVLKILTSPSGTIKFYQTACFQVLKNWLDLTSQHIDLSTGKIQKMAGEISPALVDFLSRIHFPEVWPKLQKNYHSLPQLQSAFHIWFDGLKTLQLIHYLSAGPFPKAEPEEVLPSLWQWAGLAPPVTFAEHLSLLRRLQIGEDYQD